MTIQEFNLWKEEDGDQEVMLFVRLLRRLIQDLLAVGGEVGRYEGEQGRKDGEVE